MKIPFPPEEEECKRSVTCHRRLYRNSLETHLPKFAESATLMVLPSDLFEQAFKPKLILSFVRIFHYYWQRVIVEPRNGWVWKGPLGITSSNAPAEARSARLSCPGLCPVRVWASPQMETLQPLLGTLLQCVEKFTVKNRGFLMFRFYFLCFRLWS